MSRSDAITHELDCILGFLDPMALGGALRKSDFTSQEYIQRLRELAFQDEEKAVALNALKLVHHIVERSAMIGGLVATSTTRGAIGSDGTRSIEVTVQGSMPSERADLVTRRMLDAAFGVGPKQLPTDTNNQEPIIDVEVTHNGHDSDTEDIEPGNGGVRSGAFSVERHAVETDTAPTGRDRPGNGETQVASTPETTGPDHEQVARSSETVGLLRSGPTSSDAGPPGSGQPYIVGRTLPSKSVVGGGLCKPYSPESPDAAGLCGRGVQPNQSRKSGGVRRESGTDRVGTDGGNIQCPDEESDSGVGGELLPGPSLCGPVDQAPVLVEPVLDSPEGGTDPPDSGDHQGDRDCTGGLRTPTCGGRVGRGRPDRSGRGTGKPRARTGKSKARTRKGPAKKP